MMMDPRKIVSALSRFFAILLGARALTAFLQWINLRSIAVQDSMFGPTRDLVAVTCITHLVIGLAFFVLAPTFARWCDPEGEGKIQESSEGLAFIGVRLVALAFVALGLVLAVSSSIGWYLQVSSPNVTELWFSAERVRSGALSGLVAAISGVVLWRTSPWLARHLITSRSAA